MDLTSAILSEHALPQVVARGLDSGNVFHGLQNPESVREVRAGRIVAQAVLDEYSSAPGFMLRVFVDVDRNPPEVITIYRTSKIKKYRSQP